MPKKLKSVFILMIFRFFLLWCIPLSYAIILHYGNKTKVLKKERDGCIGYRFGNGASPVDGYVYAVSAEHGGIFSYLPFLGKHDADFFLLIHGHRHLAFRPCQRQRRTEKDSSDYTRLIRNFKPLLRSCLKHLVFNYRTGISGFGSRRNDFRFHRCH